MEDFAYTLKFKAKDKPSSLQVMTAVAKLVKHLSPADLSKFADVAETKPEKIQLAKQFI
jgi:hypothetical protein